MIDYKLIGKRIKQARETRGLTQEKVAESAEITIVYLSKIENGKVRPTLEVLDRVCTAIELDFGRLFSNTSQESQNYQMEPIAKLFRECAPRVKPIALALMEDLAKLPR